MESTHRRCEIELSSKQQLANDFILWFRIERRKHSEESEKEFHHQEVIPQNCASAIKSREELSMRMFDI